MADIVIRGMEMPKTCTKCRFAVDGFCYAYPGVNIFALQENIRPDWCPLVPLPEGHGRLGDLDALLREHGLGKDCENCDRNTRDCNYDICLSRMDVCGWIDDAPTIVPAEGGGEDG